LIGLEAGPILSKIVSQRIDRRAFSRLDFSILRSANNIFAKPDIEDDYTCCKFNGFLDIGFSFLGLILFVFNYFRISYPPFR